MNYENQIASFLNDQLDLNSMKSNLLQKKAMIEEKIEAKKEIGAEDLGLSALIGEFGYSSASQFLSKYGVDQIKSFMSDIGLGEDTVGKVGDMLKNGLNKGDLDPDSFFDFIRGNLRDLNTSVKDIKAAVPDGVKALADVKATVPKLGDALPSVGDAVPDGVKVLADVKAAVPDGVKALAPEIKAILPDVKPFVGIKSSSGLGKSINTDDLDLDVMTTAEKNIFFRSLDKIGPNIKELVSNMRKPVIKETNIDDLLFKRDLASDSDPLSIEGAPEAIKMFSESGEFVGNTLSRVYNKSKLMESLPDISPSLVKPPPPPTVGPEAPASEAAEDIAPKLVQDVAPKLAQDVVQDVGEKVASEASSEAIGATTEAISGALDATGLLAPIGAAIGLGTAIYSAFTGIEDLFKTHHVSNYIPPPITSLFQAT